MKSFRRVAALSLLRYTSLADRPSEGTTAVLVLERLRALAARRSR